MSSHPSSLCCSVSSQQIHHLPCRYCIFSPRRWGPWSKRKEIPQRFTPPRGTSDQSCLVKLWQVVFIMIRNAKCDELGYKNWPMINLHVKFCGAKIGTLILIRKACGGIFLVRPERVSDCNIPWSNGSILDISGDFGKKMIELNNPNVNVMFETSPLFIISTYIYIKYKCKHVHVYDGCLHMYMDKINYMHIRTWRSYTHTYQHTTRLQTPGANVGIRFKTLHRLVLFLDMVLLRLKIPSLLHKNGVYLVNTLRFRLW